MITTPILWWDTLRYLTKVSTLLPYTCFVTTTVSTPSRKTNDLRSSVIRLEDGEFVMSLTQVIHPPVVGPMVLNDFTHAVGLEVGSLFDDSAPSISVNMSEYTGEPSDLSVQQIPPSSVGNDIGKVARIRRVPDSKEPPNGLAPATRSRPRSLVSVPPYFLDITQAKSFGKLFLQILVPILPLFFKSPVFVIPSGLSTQSHQQFCLYSSSPQSLSYLRGSRPKTASIFPSFRSC